MEVALLDDVLCAASLSSREVLDDVVELVDHVHCEAHTNNLQWPAQEEFIGLCAAWPCDSVCMCLLVHVQYVCVHECVHA